MPYRAFSGSVAAIDSDHIPARAFLLPLKPQFFPLRTGAGSPGGVIGEISTVIVFPFLDRIYPLAKIDQHFVVGLLGPG
jgi:hypothetical protein